MRPALELKFGHQLTMTPQLQQAIKLLQMSALDLQQEIQSTLESNPMLEIDEDHNDPASTEDTPNNEIDASATADNNSPESKDSTEPSEHAELNEQEWDNTLPDDLPVDSAWEDTYQNTAGSAASSEPAPDFEANNTVTESLHDHLLWQLNLTPMSEVDHLIAMTIIDSTGDDGYLQSDPDTLLASVNRYLSHEAADQEPIELDEVLAVLHRLQHFDPIGVFAQDLSECLALQLSHLPDDTPWLKQATDAITNHIGLLGTLDYTQLMRRLRVKQPELQQILTLIQTLNPKPGDVISQDTAEYVVPDVVVKKISGKWRVELNADTMPKVRINADYASLAKSPQNSRDNATYLKDHLQEARWFLKSLQSRNDTLLKVATTIAEVQQGFLEYGEEAMKPLVLHDIAESIGMHESTISRVTTQKYIHTPRGIFELKYFFSSQVSTDTGGTCSSTAIRALIKKLVAAEQPQKPLSDNKIAVILADQGINVARRTIAKYRESLSIPPSNERKRLV